MGRYFADRFWDVTDVMGIRLGSGTTALVNVRATKLVGVGAGYFKGDKFGFDGRAAGYYEEERAEAGILMAHWLKYNRTPENGSRFLFDKRFFPKQNEIARVETGVPVEKRWVNELYDKDRDALDIHVGVGVLPFAMDFDFSIIELADFLVGWLTVDISSDDTLNRAAAAAPSTISE